MQRRKTMYYNFFKPGESLLKCMCHHLCLLERHMRWTQISQDAWMEITGMEIITM